MKRYLNLLPLLLLLLFALSLALGLFNGSRQPEISKVVGKAVGPFTLQTLDHQPFSPELWRGRIVILNIFASWCEACEAEHTIMTRLAKNPQVELLGIAWNDKTSKAGEWLARHGNPYRIVAVDSRGKATIALGISGAPETFVIDREGMIAYNYKGPLTDEIADTILLPLVAHLHANAPSAE